MMRVIEEEETDGEEEEEVNLTPKFEAENLSLADTLFVAVVWA